MLKQPWYILGAGAIGCLWASYWRKSGYDVVMICPSEREGSSLQLSSDDGDIQFTINTVTLDQLANQPREIKNLLICTKAQNTLDAINAISQSISNDTQILLLQNGMTSQLVEQLLPNCQLLIGITTDGAYRTNQLSVVHAGHGKTWIGSYRLPAEKKWLENLPTEDLNIQVCNDIKKRQWKKLAINCAINAMTVIHQCRNGELLNIPAAVISMKEICREVSAVNQALDLPAWNAEAIYKQTEETLHLTSNNYSSMYQDAKQGSSTEIDFINGHLTQLAEQLHIDCPENNTVISAVKRLTNNDQ